MWVCYTKRMRGNIYEALAVYCTTNSILIHQDSQVGSDRFKLILAEGNLLEGNVEKGTDKKKRKADDHRQTPRR